MLLIERHLLRQFAETVVAVAIVLLLVTMGALFMDLIGEIATDDRFPTWGPAAAELGFHSIDDPNEHGVKYVELPLAGVPADVTV